MTLPYHRVLSLVVGLGALATVTLPLGGCILAARPDLAGLDQRFDALLIVRHTWPRHIPDAWRSPR